MILKINTEGPALTYTKGVFAFVARPTRVLGKLRPGC